MKFGPGEPLMTRGDVRTARTSSSKAKSRSSARRSAGEFIVAVLGRNELLGEMGVITNAPRGDGACKGRGARAARVADVFLRLRPANPSCALHVMRELSEHIRNDLNTMRSLREELQKARAAAGKAAPQ